MAFFLTLVVAASACAGDEVEWGLERLTIQGYENEDFWGTVRNPDSAEIISMDLDIDGDGTMERLVTFTGRDNARAGLMWTVFDQRQNGFVALGGVDFPLWGAGVLQKPTRGFEPGFYALASISGEEGRTLMWLYRFRISGGEVVTESLGKIRHQDEDKVLVDALMAGTPAYRSIGCKELFELHPTTEPIMHLWIEPGTKAGVRRRGAEDSGKLSRRGSIDPEPGAHSDQEIRAAGGVSWIGLGALLLLVAAGLFCFRQQLFGRDFGRFP